MAGNKLGGYSVCVPVKHITRRAMSPAAGPPYATLQSAHSLGVIRGKYLVGVSPQKALGKPSSVIAGHG